MGKVKNLLEELIGKKKEHNLAWQEISREDNEPLARAVKIYWETLGFKVRILKRDGKYSVFILDKLGRSSSYGTPKRKAFSFGL